MKSAKPTPQRPARPRGATPAPDRAAERPAPAAPPRAPTAEPDAADLPPGWTLVPLAQLTKTPKQDIVDGPFGSNLKASEYVDQGVPIVRLQNISRNAFLDKNIRCIPESKARELERHSFVSGDLIVTKLGDPVGKACIVPPSLPSGIIVADVVRVRIDESRASKQYAAYAINSPNVASQLSLEVKGSTRPRVNLGHIRNLEIPLPPLAEQRRIVAKLEELLGKVEASRQRLAQVPALLKRFRQAVLAAACSGRLTADWRARRSATVYPFAAESPALAVAEEQAPYGRSASAPSAPPRANDSGEDSDSRGAAENAEDLPEGWAGTELSSICATITDGDHQPPPKQPSGIPFLTIGNISSGKLDFTETRFVSEAYFSKIRADRKPQQGDVLYTVVGATIGIPVLVETAKQFCFQRHIALLRPSATTAPRFLAAMMANREFHREAWARVTGSAQPTLPLGNLRTMPVVLPPLPEQEEIVRRVEALFAVADRLEARFEQARAQVDRLAPALLAKAFRGELVPQDPRDQPASAPA